MKILDIVYLFLMYAIVYFVKVFKNVLIPSESFYKENIILSIKLNLNLN